MITLESVSKRFGKNQVLNNVGLSLAPGTITAVLGPNGSGKTTLMKSILGLVVPDQGSIKIDGRSISGGHHYRHQISYLPQVARFPENLKIMELIKMVQDIRHIPGSPEPLIKQFELEPHLEKRLQNLSGGTRQKVNTVLCFMFDTPVIIMDEPTAGLDPVAMVFLKDLIKKKKSEGKTILFSTHILSLVEELADRLVFLLDGKIFLEGDISRIIRHAGTENLERAISSLIKNKTSHSLTTELI